MLKTFFEKNKEDTSCYFYDKKIWGCGDVYRNHQGKYPVISLNFKDIKFPSWEESFEALKLILRDAYDSIEKYFEPKSCNLLML
jgi:hypothetical protein